MTLVEHLILRPILIPTQSLANFQKYYTILKTQIFTNMLNSLLRLRIKLLFNDKLKKKLKFDIIILFHYF